MTNADKFKNIFGLYATELWSMPEKDFLKWLNSEVMNCSEIPNDWIPVSERLPETDEMMLVSCRTKKGQNNVNRAYYWNGFWHGSGSMSGVVAWMPLPEPYKAGEEEKLLERMREE